MKRNNKDKKALKKKEKIAVDYKSKRSKRKERMINKKNKYLK